MKHPKPPKRKHLTPRQKKDLSLAKDQRGDWFEYGYSKGVRSKPRAAGHRKARLAGKVGLYEDPEKAEARFQKKFRARWKKIHGVSLAEDIQQKEQRRVDSFGRKKKNRKKDI